MVRWEVVGGWRSRKAWSLGASFGGREVGGHVHVPEDFFFLILLNSELGQGH